jgi:3-deoxy-D-manno-octulosonic-acid transferase
MVTPQVSMKLKFQLALYGLLMLMLSPLLKMKLRRRGQREAGYLNAVHERFGRYSAASVSQPKQGVIWIHAVSLGETRAAKILIESFLYEQESRVNKLQMVDSQLQEKTQHEPLKELTKGLDKGLTVKETDPLSFVITHSTATGRQAGQELAQSLGLTREHFQQLWYPWDTPGAVKRFLDHVQPRVGLLVETEVWPQMAMQAQARGVPLILVNARMSEKSFKKAKYFGSFVNQIYQRLHSVYAQSRQDADRLQALGARVAATTGNLKFDAVVDEKLLVMGERLKSNYFAKTSKRIIVFASSRQGEEALLFQALVVNKALHEKVQWLIVPRHPQRFEEVALLGKQLGFKVHRRSALLHLDTLDQPANDYESNSSRTDEQARLLTKLSTAVESAQSLFDARHSRVEANSVDVSGVGVNDKQLMRPPTTNSLPEVWLGDTLGEMALYYSISSVALLGGSFEPFGGQNLIEAAACGCPVVMGPHVFNFLEAAQKAIERGAACTEQTVHNACQRASSIACDASLYALMSKASASFTLENKGAVNKTMQGIASLVW